MKTLYNLLAIVSGVVMAAIVYWVLRYVVGLSEIVCLISGATIGVLEYFVMRFLFSKL